MAHIFAFVVSVMTVYLDLILMNFDVQKKKKEEQNHLLCLCLVILRLRLNETLRPISFGSSTLVHIRSDVLDHAQQQFPKQRNVNPKMQIYCIHLLGRRYYYHVSISQYISQ